MALLSDFGVETDDAGVFQPFLKHRWKIDFIFPGSRRMKSMAITAERPKVEFEDIQLDRYNSRAWIAGKHTFQPISITFEPDIGGQVHRAIRQQLERQQRLIAPVPGPLLGQAIAGEFYKFSMIMTQRDGDVGDLEKWAVEGAYLQNNDWGDWDYAASETVKTVITFRYDHARQIILPQEGKATGGAAPI